MTEAVPFTETQQINVGAHVCAMHQSPDAVLGVLAETFAAGLARGERCVLAAPEVSAAEVRRLLGEGGVDVGSAEGEGLLFLTDRDPLLAENGTEFDPDHLISAIEGLFTATIEAGYKGMRLSADVPWLTRDVPGGERAMEFEAKADGLVNVPGVPLLAICQYRLGDLDPEDSLAILENHPLTLVGGRVHENETYRRPDSHLPS
ncbi:MAG: hypothetical protein AVDCRST_MAG25-2028 [uncultured Rubrobacteraceae bacterium]|uniref:MEDS domain-containing protein n=1 Tax=uncultured Rubrobacteraceae bacterium TaxID=349277 RepID=A0A6J4RDD2_9ACTN|nr:MAG: hypothetical protein AVDCRST_MAG25-2028 [uncultured Rubrobacteraceae bacterium]